jgi:hypothetical protein
MKRIFKMVTDAFRRMLGKKTLKKGIELINLERTDAAVLSMCSWVFSDVLRSSTFRSQEGALPFVTIRFVNLECSGYDDGSKVYVVTADLRTLTVASVYRFTATFKIVPKGLILGNDSGWHIQGMSFNILLPEILDRSFQYVHGVTVEDENVLKYLRYFELFLTCACK